ncbi:metalloregulator ArsR/SmtB family transcription factor [Nocardioides sp. HDW12B]|uniref:ArsR/SmtB family transcription factor n=1 Tax=Nocardioides sp. HDW12B TaxID=2714939 RepID=UPI001F0FB484|nr:metalloregulator ArsR/SmtB family transcription factor [Nocardioides sp. HDW12B]
MTSRDVSYEPDRLFHALADATRRDILRRTLVRELSVSALAQDYPMSFAAVQKHVAVLESAGAVTKRRRGREKLVRAEIGAVRAADLVLDELAARWQDRLDRIDDLFSPEVDPPQAPPTKGQHP